MKKKIISLALVICLLAIAIAGGTMAYFTDEDTMTNTFTSGSVAIDLHEDSVKLDDKQNYVTDEVDAIDYNDNDTTNATQAYQLHPGQTVRKDPTITVTTGLSGQKAYVAAVVTVTGDLHDLIGVPDYDNLNIHELASGGLLVTDAEQVTDWNGLSMVYQTNDAVIYQAADKANNTWTFYIWVTAAKENGANVVLFDTLTINKDWDNAEMAKINGMTIQVQAYATQTEGFADCAEAMEAAFEDVFPTSTPAQP